MLRLKMIEVAGELQGREADGFSYILEIDSKVHTEKNWMCREGDEELEGAVERWWCCLLR